jgi:hypothetical protein
VPQKAIIDSNLEQLIIALKTQKKTSSTQRATNDSVQWLRPPVGEKWDGDLQKFPEMHKPFATDEAEKALSEAYDPQSPGNASDSVVLPLQIDYAAQMERAFRARHAQSFPRAVAHLSAREKGHGTDVGALAGNSLNYFLLLISQGTT